MRGGRSFDGVSNAWFDVSVGFELIFSRHSGNYLIIFIPMDQLLSRKDALERRIKCIVSELDGLRVGINGRLLDAEGYPRNDIDLYHVRELRNEHAHLQTDHQALMKEIESQLPKYFNKA